MGRKQPARRNWPGKRRGGAWCKFLFNVTSPCSSLKGKFDASRMFAAADEVSVSGTRLSKLAVIAQLGERLKVPGSIPGHGSFGSFTHFPTVPLQNSYPVLCPTVFSPTGEWSR